MKAPKTKPYIVVISDEGLEDINRIAAQMAKIGFSVNRVLPISGIVSGQCTVEIAKEVVNLDGVDAVEEEAVARIDPPEIGDTE